MDLLSLRYPLVLAAFAQAVLIFWLFPRSAPLPALVAAVAVNALGLVQFLDPTANWYSLFLVIALAAALGWLPRTRRRLLVTGFLLGTMAVFRPFSGAAAGLGVLAYLLAESHDQAAGRQVLLERLVLGAAGAGVIAYLLFQGTDPFTWFLIGVWPLLLLGDLAWRAATPNGVVARTLGWLALGALAATVPLWLYHLAHGSTRAWLTDLVSVPAAGTAPPFLRLHLYLWLALSSFGRLFSTEALHGVYWLALLLATAVNGVMALRVLRTDEPRRLPALPVLAASYGLVSLRYQIPIYLHFSVGLTVASILLMLAREARPRVAWAGAGLVALLACLAIRYHAAQPLSRGLPGIAAGRRVALPPSAPLPRSHLWIERDERDLYAELLSLIQTQSGPEESILSVPSNAELYFLSGRRNPFRFVNTALGIPDEAALARAEAALRAAPPRLVVFAPANKYNTPLSLRLMESVRKQYPLLRTIGGFEIYRRAD